MKNTKKARAKEILNWLLHEDIKKYFQDGELSNLIPIEVKQVINHLSKVMNAQYSAEILKKQMELSALQSQINPHFLYNSLEAIRSQALKNGVNEVAKMTEKLSRYFRYCISCKDDFVTIQEEIDNINDYFFIIQFRFEDKFKLKILVEIENLLECYIPQMTLQPIIENAIYHGLEPKKDGGEITLRIWNTENKIYITISDNGVGIDNKKLSSINEKLINTPTGLRAEKNNVHSGIALYNVNSRINLFFGNDYGIHLSSILGFGTDVEIIIPSIKEHNLNEFLIR